MADVTWNKLATFLGANLSVFEHEGSVKAEVPQ